MSAVALQPEVASAPLVAPAAAGTSPTFADMAAFILRSREAHAMLEEVQLRLGVAFTAVGLTLGKWSARPTRRDTGMAVLLKTLRVTDPLNEARYELMLWLSVRQVGPWSALHVRVEARDVVSGRVFGRCDPVVRSWGTLELDALVVAWRQAFVELAEDPAAWEGEHFYGLAAELSVANAP